MSNSRPKNYIEGKSGHKVPPLHSIICSDSEILIHMPSVKVRCNTNLTLKKCSILTLGGLNLGGVVFIPDEFIHGIF